MIGLARGSGVLISELGTRAVGIAGWYRSQRVYRPGVRLACDWDPVFHPGEMIGPKAEPGTATDP